MRNLLCSLSLMTMIFVAVTAVPTSAEGAPAHLLKPAQADKEDAGDVALRVGAEVLGGTVAFAVCGAIVGLVVLAGDNILDNLVAMLMIGPLLAVVMAFGVPAGIYAGGELAGGDSGFGYTLLGFLGGFATALATTLPFDPDGGITFLIVATLSLAGGILGYELANESSEEVAMDAQSQPMMSRGVPLRRSPFFVRPVYLGEGAVVGFQARF